MFPRITIRLRVRKRCEINILFSVNLKKKTFFWQLQFSTYSWWTHIFIIFRKGLRDVSYIFTSPIFLAAHIKSLPIPIWGCKKSNKTRRAEKTLHILLIFNTFYFTFYFTDTQNRLVNCKLSISIRNYTVEVLFERLTLFAHLICMIISDDLFITFF